MDFGSEVALLVDGVTKLDGKRLGKRVAERATFAKMVPAMLASETERERYFAGVTAPLAAAVHGQGLRATVTARPRCAPGVVEGGAHSAGPAPVARDRGTAGGDDVGGTRA